MCAETKRTHLFFILTHSHARFHVTYRRVQGKRADLQGRVRLHACMGHRDRGANNVVRAPLARMSREGGEKPSVRTTSPGPYIQHAPENRSHMTSKSTAVPRSRFQDSDVKGQVQWSHEVAGDT